MKWIFLPVIFAASLVSAQGKPTDVVATVGTKKITLDEFNRKYKEVTSQVLSNPPMNKAN